jgi:Leu/Phe-tRNA-protein transferase
MCVEGAGGVEAPTWLARGRRRIGPAVTNQLVDALKKKAIRLGFQISLDQIIETACRRARTRRRGTRKRRWLTQNIIEC